MSKLPVVKGRELVKFLRVSKGKCIFCNATFSKAVMTKHLKSCEQRKAATESSLGKRKTLKTKIFHIVVEGRFLPQYWLHLEAPANATLEDLDDFLRGCLKSTKLL